MSCIQSMQIIHKSLNVVECCLICTSYVYRHTDRSPGVNRIVTMALSLATRPMAVRRASVARPAPVRAPVIVKASAVSGEVPDMNKRYVCLLGAGYAKCASSLQTPNREIAFLCTGT